MDLICYGRVEVAKENRFVVDLGNMKLTARDRQSVAAAIQGAVLSYLAAQGHAVPIERVTLLGNGIAGMFIPDVKPPGGKK